jgi:hypothetical protein
VVDNQIIDGMERGSLASQARIFDLMKVASLPKMTRTTWSGGSSVSLVVRKRLNF